MLLIWCESREQSGAAVCPGIAEEDVAIRSSAREFGLLEKITLMSFDDAAASGLVVAGLDRASMMIEPEYRFVR